MHSISLENISGRGNQKHSVSHTVSDTGCETENEFAAYRLGKLYLAGEELPKNTELALHYLKMAADTGNQYAQYALGKVYLIGKDVQQDKELAYDYFLNPQSRETFMQRIFRTLEWHATPRSALDGNKAHAASGTYHRRECGWKKERGPQAGD